MVRPLIDPSTPHAYTEVFLVRDCQSRQEKVLKTLIKTDNPDVVRLFEQEKNILRELRHSGIPRWQDDFSFVVYEPRHQEINCLVMEYIEGENLDHWIQRNGRLRDESVALDWLRQLATILILVHGRGWYHRDIKPSNIILKSDGSLALIDFGTAKNYSNAVIGGRVTTVISSDGYTPPEQMNGFPVLQSDFYALGRTFIHLLTGKHPNDAHLDLKHWHAETDFPTSPVISIVNQLQETNVNSRFQSSEEIVYEIQYVKSHGERSGKAPIKKCRIKILMGLLAVIISVVVLIGWLNRQSVGAFISERMSIIKPEKLEDIEKLVSDGGNEIFIGGTDLGIYENKKIKAIRLFNEGLYNGDLYKKASDAFSNIRKEAKDIVRKSGDNKSDLNKSDLNDANRVLKDPTILIYRNNAEVRWRLKNKPEQNIHRIAVVAPLNNNVGQQILFGVAQAQQAAVYPNDPAAVYPNDPAADNSEEDLPKPRVEETNLEVIIANDLNNPAQAVEVAKALTTKKFGKDQDQGVEAVIGHYTTPVTCKALPVYDQSRIVVISPTSTMVDIRNNCKSLQKGVFFWEKSDVFFRTTSSTEIEARALQSYMQTYLDSSMPKIAAFYNYGEDFSEDLFNQFKGLVDKSIIKHTYDLSQENFNTKTILGQIEDTNVLLVFPDGKTGTSKAYDNALEIIKADNSSGVTQPNGAKRLILGSNPLYDAETISYLKTDENKKGEMIPSLINLKDRFVIAVDWYPNCPSQSVVSQIAKPLWRGDVNRRTALSYEAVQVLLPSLKQGKVNDNDLREDLARSGSLDEQSKVQSDAFPKKTISFDQTGDRKELRSRVLVTPNPDLQGSTSTEDVEVTPKIRTRY